MDYYTEKPTVYLDHNILDVLVKYNVSDFEKELKESYQVIYSDETLKEIKRSGEKYKDFLKILSELNAYHLKVRVNSDFTPRGDGIISDRDPFEAYADYCENIEPAYELMQEATLNSMVGIKGKVS